MSIFNLPDLGEGLPDAEITEWHVKVDDVVKTDDPLVSMETAKAVVDVPSPQAGKITKLYGKPGDIIKTGSPLVEFSSAAGTLGSTPTETKTVPEARTAEASIKTAKPRADAATVAGSIEVGNSILEESAIGITPSHAVKSRTTKATPAVRMLAKQLDVDLEQLTPSGIQGQVTAEDVKTAAHFDSNANTASTAKGPEHRKLPPPVGTQSAIEPLRGIRRAMANTMEQSHAEVVPVTVVDDADIHAWKPRTDITYRVIRALVFGCQHEPALNAHFDKEALERKLFAEINIGIAMDSKDGLLVPVLKNAENLSAKDVRAAIDRFKEQVNKRSISPEDLKGSTIQLSNFGTFAGRYANPIIVPPTVAILGIGKIRDEVVAMPGHALGVHRIMPLSVTIDHRAITGGEAARFLAAVIEDLRCPI